MTLFRAFDIDVRVHWSFILILAWGAFAYSSNPAGPVLGAIYGIVVIILLFACVTLHEFGHAVVAQRLGVNVRHITLMPLGGVASLEQMPEKPLHEFLIAIAGPIVNFVIALLLLPVLILTGRLVELLSPDVLNAVTTGMATPSLLNLITYLFFINITLGLFNLLPAFPMDGGRILRALLGMTMSNVQATRIAVFIGRIIAILLALWGLSQQTLIPLLIAFFIYMVGGAEREAVESKSVLSNIKAGDALTPEAVSLYTSERVDRAVDLIMNSYQTDYPVMDLSGKFVGVLTRARLIRALKEIGPEARIVDAMIHAEGVPICQPTQDLSEVWEIMVGGGGRVVAIKDSHEFLGLLTIDDITEVFQVYGAKLAGDQSDQGTPPPRTTTVRHSSEELNG